MNNLIERIWKQGGMVNIEDLRGTAFQAEESAHTFRIRGVDKSGEPLALTGTVGAVFLRADNTDVAITGTITDGAAEVTLTDECYDMPGRFGLTIYVTSDEQTVAVYAAIGSVCRTSSGVVSPETGEDVMDLINAINDAIEDLDEAIARIPQDYQDLEDDVAELQENVADLQEDVAELKEETNNYAPVIVKDASGDIVSIDDGAGNMKLKTLELEIEPVQDLHGYDKPWPGGGGKNLLDASAFETETKNGITFTVYKNTEGAVTRIHAEGTASSTAVSSITTSLTIPYETIISGNGTNASIDANGGTYTSTIPANTEITSIRLRVGSGKTVNTDLYPMIRLSSVTDDTFAPYSNICPISGWTGADMTRTGKNLLQIKASDVKSWNASAGSWSGNVYTRSGITHELVTDGNDNVVAIKSNGTATGNSSIIILVANYHQYLDLIKNKASILNGCPSGGSSSTYNISVYGNKNGERISVRDLGNGIALNPDTFDASNSDQELTIRPTVQQGTAVSNLMFYPMIRFATATDASYEPFGNTYTYPFPQEAGTVYGGTDTIRQDGTRTLVVDCEEVTAGTITEFAGSTAQGGFKYAFVTINNKYLPDYDEQSGTLLSEVVEAYRANSPRKAWTCYLGTSGGVPALVVVCDTSTTVEEYNSKIAGTKFIAKLKAPVPYDLTAQQVVSLLKGQNVLWADCGDVAMEYPVDTKIYIDNLFASITNATGVSF